MTVTKIANLSDGSGTIISPYRGILRQAIINGNFDVWQRGATQLTASGYLADMWKLSLVGETSTYDRGSFTLGQTSVPHNPKYYTSIEVVTATAGAGNLTQLRQSIEDVSLFSGQTVALSFYAKADSAKSIAVGFYQNFGTGGSPSSAVSIASETITLTTSWSKYEILSDIPSVSGKTLGTDFNDFLGLNFWLSAGSNYDTSTNTLGQQTGVFDIAQVSMNIGSVSLPFDPRPYAEELRLCQSHLIRFDSLKFTASSDSKTAQNLTIPFPVTMRATPDVTFGTVTDTDSAGDTLSTIAATQNGINSANFATSAVTGARYTVANVVCSAEP